MSHPQAARLPDGIAPSEVRRRERDATQRLLGDTITISDADWQRPSRLPGWTRAHVATHLARNADGFARAIGGLLGHTSTRMYRSEAEKLRDLEEGSLRDALSLQIDLDTSAGELARAFDQLEQSGLTETVVLAPGRRVAAPLLALARLNEVVLHHIDLDCGFTSAHVDEDIARWLLDWNCRELVDRPELPPLQLSSHSGLVARLGPDGDPLQVRGSDAQLLGWLTGREGPELVQGADGLSLPPS